MTHRKKESKNLTFQSIGHDRSWEEQTLSLVEEGPRRSRKSAKKDAAAKSDVAYAVSDDIMATIQTDLAATKTDVAPPRRKGTSGIGDTGRAARATDPTDLAPTTFMNTAALEASGELVRRRVANTDDGVTHPFLLAASKKKDDVPTRKRRASPPLR